MALPDRYDKPLTTAQAAHLLRRATFGASPGQIKSVTGKTPAAALSVLLASQPDPAPPVDPKTKQTFFDKPFVKESNGQYAQNLKSWWLGLMMNEAVSLREKMTLFWQNHFVSTLSTVNDARYMYRQNGLLRKNALGNFRQFVIDITKDAAMLRYLNGNQNVDGRPNENYGRELQELFTIGRGGNYSEDDVKAAARVLTGWYDTGYRNEDTATINVIFRDKQHDATDKKFSAAYNNTVIKGRSGPTAGDAELADLVDMLLAQPETARFICRKLYRFFVSADITPDIETNFIGPLATVFINGKFEIKPVLTALFTSQHFFDDNLRGAIIKSPLELLVGTTRYFESTPPDSSKDVAASYALGYYLVQRSREQQQDVMDQPTVFGWRPYYDTGFYDIWISANTLALRGFFTDQFAGGNIKTGNYRLAPASITYARTAPDPSDPVKLIDALTNDLFAISLTRIQKDFLIDNVLVAGLPRYEWTDEWLAYTADASNLTKRNAVQKKLDLLFQYLLRMAEYQLC